MSANVTNGKPATDVNVLCGYNPTNATTAANLALNQANMRYFAEANCPAEIKKQLLNWMLSAFYEVIDRGDVGVSTMGSCDSISFYQAIINLIAPCHWPLRTTAINSTTHLLAQDCPSGALQRISAQSLGVPCRSELVTAPAAGSPKVYIDDTVNPATLVYWDCGQNVYRTIVITANEGVVCRSQLATAPSAGVPRMYIDDTVNPAIVTYWDCGANIYRQILSSTSGPFARARGLVHEGELAAPAPDALLGMTATYVLGSNTTTAPNPHYTFTFTTPQADLNYNVFGSFHPYNNTSTAAVSNPFSNAPGVVHNNHITNKTVNGFDLQVPAGGFMTNVLGGLGGFWYPEFDIVVTR